MQDTEQTDAVYQFTPIGRDERGIDGSDEVFLVKRKDDAIDLKELEEVIAGRFYRGNPRPGGYFCDSWEVYPRRYRDDEVIVIVHHRYDV